jgi:myo-inositol 2-dehydrogenase / D-chiro-inositol 1-dehydrogenase
MDSKTQVSGSPITRRVFLARSAAASVAAAGAPAVLAADNPPGEFKRKIKLGVVGAGGRGCWIANLFKRHGGYEMHAIADYFPAVANGCGEGLGVDKARRFSGLNGYRKVIESGVEAIALETPPYFFPEHARAAVEAGLHVYMAKPVAVDVPGCLEIEAAAQKAGAKQQVFLVDYQLPTDPHNLEVVKMINAGEVGKVMALNTHYFAGQFADPAKTANLADRFQSLIWCNDVALGGGYHVNACIHGVDAGLWVAQQRPVACLGLSRVARPNPHGDSHDIFELVFEFTDGLIMSHRGKHINNQLQFDVVCQVLGQTGYAQICYGGKSLVKGRENGYNGEVQNPYEAGAMRNIAKFHQCVTDGNLANDTVRRSVDGALTTILGREAALRRSRLTMEELLKENKCLTLDLGGLRV